MELLDARQLRAFQELARQESFTEAAARLHLTQSAVSHSIKSLESHLQVSLFERLGKQVRLTGEGEALLPHVDAIIGRMEQALNDVINLNKPGHGRLRIGASVTISQYVLPSILRELRECFPNFEIAVSTEKNRNLVGMLEKGHLDIVVALESIVSPRLNFEPVFTDQIEMAMAPVHPLATIPEPGYEDIVGEDFIIFDRESETYRLIDEIFTDKKSRLRPSLQVGSMAAIKEMAKIGLGIGLLAPWVARDEIKSGSLVFRPLPHGEAKRTWGIYTDDRHEKVLIEGIFSGICRNVFANLQLQTVRASGQKTNS